MFLVPASGKVPTLFSCQKLSSNTLDRLGVSVISSQKEGAVQFLEILLVVRQKQGLAFLCL